MSSNENRKKLTASQKLLWLEWKSDPKSRKYNNRFYFRLNGKLEKNLLLKSLAYVTDSHYALRTSFGETKGEPYQVIHKTCKTLIKEVVVHKPMSDNEIAKLLDKILLKPFNLTKLPLFKYALIILPDNQYALGLCWHHIISDGTSVHIITNEISKYYNQLKHQEKLEFPDSEIPIDDIIEKEIKYFSDEAFNQQLDYWENRLDYQATLTSLPNIYIDSHKKFTTSKRYRHKTTAALTAEVGKFVSENNITLFIMLLSAFSLAIYFRTYKNDITLGYSVNIREKNERATLGYHVNMVPFRTLIDENSSIIKYIKNILQLRLQDKKHQRVPTNLILKAVRKKQHLNSLFNIAMNQFTYLTFNLNLEDLKSYPIQAYDNYAKFDLTLFFDLLETLEFEIEYNQKQYDIKFIMDLVEDIVYFINYFIEYPNKLIKELSPPSTISLRKEVNFINDTYQDYPKSEHIISLFEQQVTSNSHKIAIRHLDESITYLELNQRSNQLAQLLRSYGFGNNHATKNHIIAFYLPSGIDAIVTMLAILKVGSAYLPLSLEYPLDRIEHMINNSDANIIVTNESLLSNINKLQNHNKQIKIICVDSEAVKENLGKYSKDNLGTTYTPDTLAYVIYTSGSTGKPKGVAISHRAVVCRFSKINFVKIDPDENILQASNLAFDAAVFEIWAALLNGAQITVVDKDVLLSSIDFYKFILKYQPTICFLTTALLNQYIDDESQLLSNFKIIMFGGEKVNKSKSNQLQQLLTETKLIHVYGPAEATVFSSFCDFTHRKNLLNYAPIGKPISNTSLYIVNNNLELCPVGIVGELCVGGEGLTQGYLNDPELTKEKFIDNPFVRGDEGYDNTRLYKTGDLVYLLSDDNIEYVSRADNQVKIRGFRIELSEIEHELNQLSYIKEAIVDVVVRDENKHLVAYVLTKPNLLSEMDQAETIKYCFSELNKKLPSYMIPTEFHFMSQFPLTPNGKVDRLKLPKKEGFRLEHEYVAPRNEIEQIIAKIWQELLHVDKVSIDDDFFELGGDSLTVLKISSLASEKGLNLSPGLIFSYRTIKNISDHVAQFEKKRPLSKEQGEALLLPIQHFAFSWLTANPNRFNSSFLFSASEKLNVDVIKDVTKKLVQHHDSFRLRFDKDKNDNWRQYYCDGEDVYNIPIYKISGKNVKLENQLAFFRRKAVNYQNKLNITNGPILCLIYCEGKTDYLGIIVHHLLFDGISLNIFLSDFQNYYHSLISKQPIKIPPKTDSYQRWGETLYQYANSRKANQDMAYWRDLTRDIRSFPWDMNQPALQKDMAMKIVDLLSADMFKIKSMLPEILATALIITNKKLYNESGIFMHVVHHGRSPIFKDVNVSRTIGCFGTHTPLSLILKNNNIDLNDDQQLLAAIHEIKNQLLSLPDDGLSHGALRWYSTNSKVSAILQQDDKVKILFNYMGDVSDTLHNINLLKVPTDNNFFILNNMDLHNSADHLLGFHTMISGNALKLYVTYSTKHYYETTIDRIVTAYQNLFEKLFKLTKS